jgi:glycosyltransferase involved in cell wall biosynthesis
VTCHILCLSHLAWDARLFQRPQQVMTRLNARGNAVLYTGCVGFRSHMRRAWEGATTGEVRPGGSPLRHLSITYSPLVHAARAARLAAAASKLRKETARLFGSAPGGTPVAWLYHPGLLSLARAVLPGALVVYDVMDRFPAFAASPDGTVDAERELLRAADLVFAGGRSLAAAACAALPEAAKPVHCFPSGVDLAHFAAARSGATPVHPALANLPRPVLGYFGAVDERLDYDLLRGICASRPGWTVALVGPVLSRPAEAPPNLLFTGAVPYAQLPAALKGFDVCLLPFRRTELVAHVSPTKTPEYLAGGKPVVSSPIPDVEADYGEVVAIADSVADFVAACEAAAASPPDPDALAAEAASRARSWDDIAGAMLGLVAEASRMRRSP